MTVEMLKDILALRKKTFVLLLVLLVADLGLFAFHSAYQAPELEKGQKEWAVKRDAAARGVDIGVSARYREGERDLASYREHLISKKGFAAFLSEMFAMAKANSLALKSITYKPTPVGEPGMVSYVIGCEVSGRYAGAKSFIADMARYPKLVTINSVSLGNASRTEEAVALRLEFTVYLTTEGA